MSLAGSPRDYPFYLLNEAAPIGGSAPAIVLDTRDETRNDLKLVLTNGTGTAQTLTGGVPQRPGAPSSASTLYCSLPMQSSAENNQIALTPESRKLWAIGHFDSSIGLSPIDDLTITADTPLLVHLTGIADSNGYSDFRSNAVPFATLQAVNCDSLDWDSVSEEVSFNSGPAKPVLPNIYAFASDLPGGASRINITLLLDANVLTLHLKNDSGKPISPRPSGGWGPEAPQFVLAFSCGTAPDDLAPAGLVHGILVEPLAATGWTVEGPTDQSAPRWTIVPDLSAAAVLDPGQEVTFAVTQVITEADAATGVARVTVTNHNLPDFRDTPNGLGITKGYYPKIVSFKLESNYPGYHSVDAAAGETNFACYVGDDIKFSWETCGSGPAPVTPCTLTIDGTANPVGAVSTQSQVIRTPSQCTLVCNGIGTAAPAQFTVDIAMTPASIVSFIDSSSSPVVRLSWTLLAIDHTLTLEGPGIAGTIDVTASTNGYIPPTTAVGDTYTYTLTCDDGVNTPAVRNLVEPVRQPSGTLSAVFTAVDGGISLWVPGQDPVMIAPADPSAQVTDINVGCDLTDNLVIYWVDSANATLGSWTYPSPYTIRAQVTGGGSSKRRRGAAGADAPSLTYCSICAAITTDDGAEGRAIWLLAQDPATTGLYFSDGTSEPYFMQQVLDSSAASAPVLSTLTPPRLRFSAPLGFFGSTGRYLCGFGSNPGSAVSYSFAVYPFTANFAPPVPLPPGEMEEFAVDLFQGDIYWVDPGPKALCKVAYLQGGPSPTWGPVQTLYPANPIPGSLGMEFRWTTASFVPGSYYVCWLESSGTDGVYLLYEADSNGYCKEAAAVAATPGQSGLLVFAGDSSASRATGRQRWWWWWRQLLLRLRRRSVRPPNRGRPRNRGTG